jgi:hypothetical protein
LEAKLAAILKICQAENVNIGNILEWFAVHFAKPGHMVMSESDSL